MKNRLLSPSSSRSRCHSEQFPLKEYKRRRCWADLPSDLLSIIAEKASTTNMQYVHLRAVCKPWRRALRPHPHHLPPQVPWLMLPRLPVHICQRLGISDGDVSFYDIARSKTYRFQLPYMRGKCCCGSSHGWLVLELEHRVSLLNPITRECIDQLPSLDSPPTLLKKRSWLTGYLNYILKVSLSCTHSRSVPSNQAVKKGYLNYILKASLSCSPSKPGCVVVVSFSSDTSNWELGFCRIGDSQWTGLKKWDADAKLHDFAFYNNMVYTLNTKNEISVYDLEDRSVWTFPSKINFYIRMRDWVNLLEGDADSSGPLIVRTTEYGGKTTVYAYKWCDDRKVWDVVKNIKNQVFFLNMTNSINMQCDEKQEYGVYYHQRNIVTREFFRVGIHRANLESGKVDPHMPSPMDVLPSRCGFLFWLTPSLI